MFSNESDRTQHSPSTYLATVALATPVLIAVVAALVSARTTPGGWAIICIAVFLSAWPKTTWPPAFDFPKALALSLIAFFAYAAASALWAQNPLAPLSAAIFAIVTVLVTRAVINQTPTLPRHLILHMSEGIWLGLLIALTYFLAELLTNQSIKITLYNALGLGPENLKPTAYFKWNDDGSLKSISLNDMTRNTTPITLLMWSAMMAALGALRAPYAKSVAGIILALSVFCVALSPHETSKLALAIGLVVFALAYLSKRWTARAMIALWTSACILILPAALIAHDLKLHEPEAGLQNSARARIIIWNETASQTLNAPFFGVGARMTYELGPQQLAAKPKNETEWFPAKLSRHAHNAFLQTWFELGAIGVLLLLSCGVTFVGAITRLPEPSQPFALATFASAAIIAGSSYGMWQAWFIGLFAMTPIIFTIALTANTNNKKL